VGSRRYFLKWKQWRVGVSSVVYSWVEGQSLGLIEFPMSPDPLVELGIPTAATNIVQQINTGKKIEGSIEVIDFYAVTELVYTIDVDNDVAGTQKAVESNNTRTIIDYFALVASLININDTTDVRTTPDATFVFDNAIIRDVVPRWQYPNSPTVVRFIADSYTLTVA